MSERGRIVGLCMQFLTFLKHLPPPFPLQLQKWHCKCSTDNGKNSAVQSVRDTNWRLLEKKFCLKFRPRWKLTLVDIRKLNKRLNVVHRLCNSIVWKEHCKFIAFCPALFIYSFLSCLYVLLLLFLLLILLQNIVFVPVVDLNRFSVPCFQVGFGYL